MKCQALPPPESTLFASAEVCVSRKEGFWGFGYCCVACIKRPRLCEASCFRWLQMTAAQVAGANQVYVRVVIRTEDALISAITRTPSASCNASQLSLVMTATISKPASAFIRTVAFTTPSATLLTSPEN